MYMLFDVPCEQKKKGTSKEQFWNFFRVRRKLTPMSQTKFRDIMLQL